MRVFHAAALTAAALLLASIASAQGIGDAAARERDKRKTTPAKPAKVFTDSDLPASAPEVTSPAPADAKAAGQAGEAKPGDAKAADAKAAESDPEKEKEKANQEWKAKLEDARKEEQAYKDLADRIQLDLNDTSSLYTPGRARKMTTLDETKQTLADVQARIEALQEEGRRNGYR